MDSLKEIQKIIEGRTAKEAVEALIEANIIPAKTVRDISILQTYNYNLKRTSRREHAAIDTAIEKGVTRRTVYNIRKRYGKLWK